MNLTVLAEHIGATVLTPEAAHKVDIEQVYAGDRMSDLLSHVTDGTLIITHLSNHALARLIELMDVPAVCLIDGATPDVTVRASAQDTGAGIIVSPTGMFETCARIHKCLFPERSDKP